MKAGMQTGNALAVAAETTKPTVVINVHGKTQRVKAQIDFGAMSILYCRAYLENSSYRTNQHSPPPWPGDDVCKESHCQSLGSVFEHLKPVDESEVLIILMKAYNLVLGLRGQETRKLTAATVD